MADKTFREELIALEQDCIRESQAAEARLKSLEVERDGVEAELKMLTGRLTEIDQTIGLLLESRHGEAKTRVGREYRVVYHALARSMDAIADARDDWRALAKLTAQHRALIQNDPDLEQALQDYLAFEEDRPALDALPVRHRQALLDAQAALHDRVASYQSLLEAASRLWKKRPLILKIAVVRDLDRARIYWLLALTEGLRNLPKGLSDDLRPLVVTVVNGLKDIGEQGGWACGKMLMRGWAGFTEVMAEDVRIGEGDLAELTQRLVRARLNDLPLCVGEAIEAQVAECSYAAWRLGHEQPDSAQSGDAARFLAESISLAERVDETEEWYTDEDVRHWNRPFTGTLNVHWNAHARRLRTLLTRLIDRGFVAARATPMEPLWKTLPAPDDEEMRIGIEQLIAKRLLLEQADGSQRRVSINPELIAEAHNLIRREVSRFWADVLGDHLRRTG